MSADRGAFKLWHHAETVWTAHRRAIALGEATCHLPSDTPACEHGCPSCDLKCAVMAGAVAHLRRELGTMGAPAGAMVN